MTPGYPGIKSGSLQFDVLITLPFWKICLKCRSIPLFLTLLQCAELVLKSDHQKEDSRGVNHFVCKAKRLTSNRQTFGSIKIIPKSTNESLEVIKKSVHLLIKDMLCYEFSQTVYCTLQPKRALLISTKTSRHLQVAIRRKPDLKIGWKLLLN